MTKSKVAALSRMIAFLIGLLVVYSSDPFNGRWLQPPVAYAQAPSAPSATPGVAAKPQDNQCLPANLLACENNLATSKAAEAACQKELNECKTAQATGSGTPPPGKKSVGPVFTLICAPPAVVVVENGWKRCDCPEGGVPARMVDKDAPAFKSNIIKGVCVTPHDTFLKKVDELLKLHAQLARSPRVQANESLLIQLQKTGDDLADLLNWYNKLIAAGVPLNDETWMSLNQRVSKIESDLNAVTNVYCPFIPNRPNATMEERCRAEHDTFCKKGDKECSGGGGGVTSAPALLAAVEGHIRPGGTHSLHLRVDAVWSNYSRPTSRDGFFLHGGAGLSLNADVTRYAVAAGAGWVHDLSYEADRAVALRLGLGYRAEPTIGPNDVHALGGTLSADWRLKSLFLTLGVLVGGNVTALYDDGDRTNQRSDIAFVVAPGAGIGVAW